MQQAERESQLDELFLHGIVAHGHHGVYESERRDGQSFVIDASWWIDISDATNVDEIAATICYEDLHGAIVRFVSGEPVHLLETLALGLIQMLFDRYGRISRIRITVHKPQAPIRGTFSDVGITVTRSRP